MLLLLLLVGASSVSELANIGICCKLFAKGYITSSLNIGLFCTSIIFSIIDIVKRAYIVRKVIVIKPYYIIFLSYLIVFSANTTLYMLLNKENGQEVVSLDTVVIFLIMSWMCIYVDYKSISFVSNEIVSNEIVSNETVSNETVPSDTTIERQNSTRELIILIDKYQLDKEIECVICREITKDIVRFDCSHIFHKECIKTWIRSNYLKTCPICRVKLSI